MAGRFLIAALCAVTLAACGDAAAPEDPLADLGDGATAGIGKEDSASGVIFSSAMTVGPLLYAHHEQEGEKQRPADDLAVVFGERVKPAALHDQPWRYLKKMSALGYYGPIGPYGPLGLLGPTGDNVWNADHYTTGSFAWADWSKDLDREDRPLSSDGPLGHKGPLNPELWDAQASAALSSDFVKHLGPGAIYAPLGPIGVSGALGPLGPLGPIGAHGYKRGDDGDYLPEEGVCADAPDGFQEPPCRRVQVDWDGSGDLRTYELFEHYTEERAAEMGDNDTSFMVVGRARKDEPDTFTFTSNQSQWVTVMVVPEYAKYPFVQAMAVLGQSALLGYEVPSTVSIPHLVTGIGVPQSYDHRASFDDFDLQVALSQDGKELGQIVSQSGDGVDWIHARVPAGTTFTARVTLFREWEANPFSDGFWGLAFRPSLPKYRLIVVGSTDRGQGNVIFSGPYLQSL